MIQLFLHLIGDYLLQNDNVGTRKKEKSMTGHIYCTFHCTIYGILFALFFGWKIGLLIGLAHFAIDRYNWLAKVIAFKNNVWKTYYDPEKRKVVTEYDTSNFGYNPDKPFAVAIWSYIIQDNILHLIINFLIIKYGTL